jgi:hypothetical protein
LLKWVGERKVLFPTSDISVKTMSSVFSPDNKIEVAIYRTHIEAEIVLDCSYYVFTSPSNVQGFFRENSTPPDAIIIETMPCGNDHADKLC